MTQTTSAIQPSRWALAGAALAGAALVALAACHQALPPHTVSETPARAPVRDDPAAKGDWTQPIRLPDGAVVEAATEHDFPAYSAVHGDRFDLAPAAAREVPVAMVGASLVVARAIAFGKAGPLELAIREDGAAVATAAPIALPPDRSEAAVAANLDGSGAVTVHIANPSPDPVTVSLVVEIAPGGH
jgi:hypothetical protein